MDTKPGLDTDNSMVISPSHVLLLPVQISILIPPLIFPDRGKSPDLVGVHPFSLSHSVVLCGLDFSHESKGFARPGGPVRATLDSLLTKDIFLEI